MSLTKKDIKKIQVLVKEGKRISKINSEDFPDEDYWSIYDVAYTGGQMSSFGIRKMITYRLNTLRNSGTDKDILFLNELDDLIRHLYDTIKSNQQKLDKIRKLLS